MKIASTTPRSTSVTGASASSPKVLSRRALRYDDGELDVKGRPPHVRAGSGCVLIDIPQVGRRLAVVQDDAPFIALVDVDRSDGRGVTALAVPMEAPPGGAFVDGVFDPKVTKRHKLDLESVVSFTLDGRPALLAFGSGSGATTRREHVVLCTFDGRGDASVEVFAAGAFYKKLERAEFCGDERNIEGAVVVGDRLRLFQRGNGAGDARDAVGEVSLKALLAHLRDPLVHAAPSLTKVQSLRLGDVDGTRLTITDATLHPDGRTLFLAAAEASPNTWDDGVVKGTALGVLEADGSTRSVPFLDEKGRPLVDKVEGIVVDPRDPRRAFVVVDRDDPTIPAELLVVSVPTAPTDGDRTEPVSPKRGRPRMG
jgi:hypothetical protein